MRIAVLLEDLSGGGVERTMLALVGGFLARGHAVDLLLGVKRGHAVDLLLGLPTGQLGSEVPQRARVVLLEARSSLLAKLEVLRADPAGIGALARPVLLARAKHLGGMLPRLPSLVGYLRRERPDVLVSAKYRPNLCAVWARAVAKVPTRLVLTERNSPSEHFPTARAGARHRAVPRLMRRYYEQADQVVTVSRALAQDLARFAGLPSERIMAIYNPIVDERIALAARKPAGHPWLDEGGPPVILGVGRIEPRKGFATLMHAFALVRQQRPARLVILGEAKATAAGARHRGELLALAVELGIAEDVAFPGFKLNPYAFMARAAAFVLASEHEGLPGVLIQALACGCPVVATDCPTGPREILEDGRYGPLVPVGDHVAMAKAITGVLDTTPPVEALRGRGAQFGVDAAVDAYLHLFGEIGGPRHPLQPLAGTPAMAPPGLERA